MCLEICTIRQTGVELSVVFRNSINTSLGNTVDPNLRIVTLTVVLENAIEMPGLLFVVVVVVLVVVCLFLACTTTSL